MKEAASLLGVSNATVSNWVKLGTLNLVDNTSKKLLLKNTVIELKNSIANGKSDKLKSRANKIHVSKKRIHKEINDSGIDGFLCEIDSICTDENYQSILISLALLVLQNESINFVDGGDREWIKLSSIEIESWKNEVVNFTPIELNVSSDILSVVDILGKTYQHISESHKKAIGGVFYTPITISNEIVSNNLRKNEVVLDPCCGSGSFLIQALLKKIKDKDEDFSNSIIGCDIDAVAVHICKLNLLFVGKEKFTHMPKIFVKDVIGNPSAMGASTIATYRVDCVCTNPPWGANLSINQKEQFCGSDSFSLFLKSAIDNVRGNGRLAFLLPESFIDVAAHYQIRRKLLTECSDIVITKLGKAFVGMLTNVVLLEAKVGSSKPSQRITLKSNNATTNATHEEILEKKFAEFVFDIDGSKHKLINKIYSAKHKFLGSESDYSLGIVTGNNAKLVLDSKVDGSEGILKGKDIKPYKFSEPSQFIKFDRSSFQQCSDEKLFRASEKIIYRFISDKLIFSYDNKGTLTLNSANFIIPKLGIPVKVVLAILQSSVSQFIFEAKFNSVKVLKKHLQELPIFLLEKSDCEKIEMLVDQILMDENDVSEENLKAINAIIYDFIGLSYDEILAIENTHSKRA